MLCRGRCGPSSATLHLLPFSQTAVSWLYTVGIMKRSAVERRRSRLARRLHPRARSRGGARHERARQPALGVRPAVGPHHQRQLGHGRRRGQLARRLRRPTATATSPSSPTPTACLTPTTTASPTCSCATASSGRRSWSAAPTGPPAPARTARSAEPVDQRQRALRGVPQPRDEPRAGCDRRRVARLRARPGRRHDAAGRSRRRTRRARSPTTARSTPSITVVGGNPVVAFTSGATNLDGATAGRDAGLRARSGRTTRAMVSRPNGRRTSPGNGASTNPSISTDGTRVAFQSSATNLSPGDSTPATTCSSARSRERRDALASACSAGTATPATRRSAGTATRVAFASASTNLVAADSDAASDVLRAPVSRTSSRWRAARPGRGRQGRTGRRCSRRSPMTAARRLQQPERQSRGPGRERRRRRVPAPPLRGTNDGLISRPDAGVESDGASTAPSIARLVGNNTRLIAFTTTATTWAPTTRTTSRRCTRRADRASCSAEPGRCTSRGPTGTGGVPQRRQREPPAPAASAAARTRSRSARTGATRCSSPHADELVGGRRQPLHQRVPARQPDGRDGAGEPRRRAPRARRRTAPRGRRAAASSSVRATRRSARDLRRRQPDRVRRRRPTNLVADDANALPDVFVRDVAAATTALASGQPDGSPDPRPPLRRPGDQRRRQPRRVRDRASAIDAAGRQQRRTCTCATSAAGTTVSSAGAARRGRRATTARARRRSTPTAATSRSAPRRPTCSRRHRRQHGQRRVRARRRGRAGAARQPRRRRHAPRRTTAARARRSAPTATGSRSPAARRTWRGRRPQRRRPRHLPARHGGRDHGPRQPHGRGRTESPATGRPSGRRSTPPGRGSRSRRRRATSCPATSTARGTCWCATRRRRRPSS